MDLVNFTITRLSNASLSVPRWRVEGRVVDSKTQQSVIADFTAANAITFPNVLSNLSAAQQDEFVERVVRGLIFQRFGI